MTGSAARIRDARPAAGVSSWPHDADHSPELSIGRVVEELAEEFPAISLSKVRYLESEGLVNPARMGRATVSTPPQTWSVFATSWLSSVIRSLL